MVVRELTNSLLSLGISMNVGVEVVSQYGEVFKSWHINHTTLACVFYDVEDYTNFEVVNFIQFNDVLHIVVKDPN